MHDENFWLGLATLCILNAIEGEATHAGEVETLAFSNFSQALSRGKQNQGSGAYSQYTVDYSKQELSKDEEERAAAGKKLGAVGDVLQKAFKGPQDVEGAFVGQDIFIVQTRPQPWSISVLLKAMPKLNYSKLGSNPFCWYTFMVELIKYSQSVSQRLVPQVHEPGPDLKWA